MERLHKSRSELRSKDEEYRSRSPHRKHDKETKGRTSKHHRDERHRRNRSSNSSSSEENIAKTKTNPEVTKSASSGLSGLKTPSSSGSLIQLKLNPPTKRPLTQPPKPTVASAFKDDSDDEPEEMPQECKMRMRNIGKHTPTSCGPNSYGKTKLGFVDNKKIFEKKMNQMLKDMGDPV